MGKNYRGNKELSKEQELRFENHKLKRMVSSLRKQLARIDLDRYDHVKNIVEEHYANEEVEQNTQDMLKSLKNEWLCRQCSVGFLEINLYSRMDGTFYYRMCNHCPNRTKSQKYDKSQVKGIMKETQPEITETRKKISFKPEK